MKTADLVDQYGPLVRSCETQFRQFGGRSSFFGPVRTIRTREDNALVREILGTPGGGGVLVVDGEGSLRVALLGDQLATLAATHGWNGIVIFGAVRDSDLLSQVPIGIKALGTNPSKSTKARFGEVGAAVTFGGVTFRDGDWIYSDCDGLLASQSQLEL